GEKFLRGIPMSTGTPPLPTPPVKAGPLTTLRNWFFAGVVVAAPIGITIWLIWSFVSFVDMHIKPLIPRELNPETYLNFALPGLGIVVAVVGLVVLGAFAANLFGRWALRSGERLVARVPLVSSIRSEEHTSELQSRENLVCRLLLEKKKK